MRSSKEKMPFLHFNLNFIILILSLVSYTSKAQYGGIRHLLQQQEAQTANTVIVDQSGQGNFPTIQSAIDSVPSNSDTWTHIHVKAGTYHEKVTVPIDKKFIILEGEGSGTTTVEWSEAGSATGSAVITLNGDNFVGIDITFKNTYNLGGSNSMSWAAAATIYADKASFYGCGFVGVQDTLSDISGRHYFKSCYIEGAIDFIWGSGQSIYQKCVLNATSGVLNGTAGHITAQARESASDTNGFVFLSCNIEGTGPAYLGRAYRPYARVLFSRTFMSNIIVPEGWELWYQAGHENDIMYSEDSCSGPGANMQGRVKWEKTLPPEELKKLTDINSFINEDGWIESQPKVK